MELKQKIEELKSLGADAVFPRPFIHTVDDGSGVMNFVGVHPQIGTLKHADEIIEFVHSKGIIFKFYCFADIFTKFGK